MRVARHSQPPQSPSRVVLIGARGFIGKALQRQLHEQQIPTLTVSSSDLDLARGDAPARLAALLKPSDAVVMLAALTPDKGRDIATFMKNLAMMQSVCGALGETRPAHLVYFSSDAVYDSASSRVTEETLPSPQTLYGAMHYARELMSRSIAGLPVLVLRPTGVYGPGDPHNSYGPNRFLRSARETGKIALFGGGEEMRDHIHVDDVAALTLRCLMHKTTGTLNLVTGRSVPFHTVAQLIRKHVASMVEIAQSPRGDPVTHRHYDVTNLIKLFPDFRFTPLEDALASAGSER